MFLGLFRGQSVAFSSPGGGCGAPWLSAERPRWGIFFFLSVGDARGGFPQPGLAALASLGLSARNPAWREEK